MATSTTTTSASNANIQNTITTAASTITYDSNITGIQGTNTTTYSDYTFYPSVGNTLVYNGYSWNYNNEKENNNKMNNEFNFGPYNNQNIRLSPYGIAVKNKAGKWVSYDKNKRRIIDVDIFNIEINPTKIFYKLPKATKDVAEGDLILHNNILMFVEWKGDNRITAIDPIEGTEKTILPAVSPFGFDYIPVILSLTDYLPEPDEDNPFGNLLPIILSNNDNAALIPLLLTAGGDFSNIDPMLLLAASGNNAFLMMQIMMKQNKNKIDRKTELQAAIREAKNRKKE